MPQYKGVILLPFLNMNGHKTVIFKWVDTQYHSKPSRWSLTGIDATLIFCSFPISISIGFVGQSVLQQLYLYYFLGQSVLHLLTHPTVATFWQPRLRTKFNGNCSLAAVITIELREVKKKKKPGYSFRYSKSSFRMIEICSNSWIVQINDKVRPPQVSMRNKQILYFVSASISIEITIKNMVLFAVTNKKEIQLDLT